MQEDASGVVLEMGFQRAAGEVSGRVEQPIPRDRFHGEKLCGHDKLRTPISPPADGRFTRRGRALPLRRQAENIGTAQEIFNKPSFVEEIAA
ncbi:hypothetical protein GCM10022248_89780 [Nonomuraea soli]